MTGPAAPRSTRRPRRWLLAVASLLGGLALAAGAAAPATAAVDGTVTLGSSTLTSGGSTTVSATFTVTLTSPDFVEAFIRIRRQPGATGTASLSSASISDPIGPPCDIASAGTTSTAACASTALNATIAATITMSSDAVGTWVVDATASECTGAPGSGTCVGGLPVGAPQTLTVTPAYTATFSAQSPSPALPPSTLASTVTFTRTGTSNVNIGVDLEGTGGEGTLSNFVTDGGGTCTATSTRGFRCPWGPSDPNSVTLRFDVNVGAGATPPDWTLLAVLNDGAPSSSTLATRSVVIGTTTTSTTSTTVAPTSSTVAPTTAAPTTAAPTTAAPTTAAPAGALPATGPSNATMTALLGLLALAVGVMMVRFARRSPDHTRG